MSESIPGTQIPAEPMSRTEAWLKHISDLAEIGLDLDTFATKDYVDDNIAPIVEDAAELESDVATNTSDIEELKRDKVNIQQDIADSGKALVVGGDGKVSPQTIAAGEVVIDTMLNTPGAAADAKATGEAISGVNARADRANSVLRDVGASYNLFNVNSYTDIRTYIAITPDGSGWAYTLRGSASTWVHSFVLPIVGGKTYTVSRKNVCQRFACGSAPQLYSGSGDMSLSMAIMNNTGNHMTIMTNVQDEYLYVWFNHTNDDTDNTLEEMMVAEGSSVLPYMEYGIAGRTEVKPDAIPSEVITKRVIEEQANRYEAHILTRELFLRNKYHYDGIGIWYGAEWTEDGGTVAAINSEGHSDLHSMMPIQSKMRRCLVKNGVLNYYLDEDDSSKKTDGTNAVLDGTDGDVCVEVPEFFFKFEEETSENVRTVRLKISENGIDGFSYSPKMFVSAYESTINRDTGILASVCTTALTFDDEEVKIESVSSYKTGNYSLGMHKVATRTGFTSNAKMYRGGNNDDTYDNSVITDPNYWQCQLGIPCASYSRDAYAGMQDVQTGKMMYTYEAFRALWILSMVEFKTKNIQKAIASGGLGYGATRMPSYDNFKAWEANSSESIIPCGVTNCLGNHSGETFIKLTNIPVGDVVDPSIRADVWMPCVSYRGVEHYYGHLYNVLSNIIVDTVDTGEITTDGDGKPIYDVTYKWARNPFRLDAEDIVGEYTYCSKIRNTVGYVFGYDGHILPCRTVNSANAGYGYTDEETYCDCTEINNVGKGYQMDVNGSIISFNLPGRAFMVACIKADGSTVRVSNGTRIVYPIA